MRHFTKALTLIALLCGQAFAQAQQRTYTQSIPFQTTQSMWSAGATGVNTSVDLTKRVNSGPIDEQARRHIDFLGTFSAGVSANFNCRAGLVLKPYAREGNVNVSYPVTLNLNYPDPATLASGQTFILTSSWTTGAPNKSVSMTTSSPRAGVVVDGVLDADSAYLYLTARAFGEWVFRKTVFNTSFDYSRQLFDTADIPEGNRNIFNGMLSIKNQRPNLSASVTVSPGQKYLSASASGEFFRFGGNITNLLSYLLSVSAGLPQPVKFSDSINASYRGTGFRGNYDFLKLNVDMPFTFGQQFQFWATPSVTLTLSTGQTVRFAAGQSVQLTMPANGAPLTITPSVSLENNQFINATSLGYGSSSLVFTPLNVKVDVSLAGWGLPDLDYSAGQYNLVQLSNASYVRLPGQAFALGFAPVTLPEFSITRPTP